MSHSLGMICNDFTSYSVVVLSTDSIYVDEINDQNQSCGSPFAHTEPEKFNIESKEFCGIICTTSTWNTFVDP